MRIPFMAAVLCLWTVPGHADPAIGIWQTEPDRKNLVSHIEIAACGAALCGTILRAFDASGQQVNTANIGKRLFWGLKSVAAGTYDGGTVWVPLLDIEANAKARLDGDRFQVTGCKGPVCDGQVWRRVP